MLQLIQNYRTGKLELADVPVPNISANTILVKNYASLISIGTERSIIELGRKSLFGKARSRPDLVKRFLDKAKKEGFLKTFQEALGRLDNPVPLGYSSAGVVVEVGRNIHKFAPGDKVACIGAGYASHAEYITVPENLCCRIPDDVSFEEASFGMLGIIAMHGIRCGNLTFGERVAVIGLGLLGLLTIQILKAYGCMVMGFDIDVSKVEMARKLGVDAVSSDAEDFKNLVDKYTDGFGADAVIITAATKSDAPINLAVDIARFRGRIVVVGVADIHPDRNELWHKEVEIIVSKAAGPGSLDPVYENKGIDYPTGYIRWTENRNLEEFLRLVSGKKVILEPLITHKFPIEKAIQVYENIMNNRCGPYIGVVLEYSKEKDISQEKLKKLKETAKNSSVVIGIIGAGLFGKALLIPALSKLSDVRFHTLSTSSGINSYQTAKKYGFENATSDYRWILNNGEINSVVILTPHSLHAKMVKESLQAGKHVFVEKPLCINEEELKEITDVYSSVMDDGKSIPFLMVGYNRRFSPHVEKLKSFVSNRKDPLMINYRVNAGFVPSEHWVHSEEEGGGRIIGEICHFIDLMIYLTNSLPIQAYADRVSGNNKTIVNEDNVSIVIKFRDGSVGNIFYSSSGDKSFSRERIEVYSEGKTLIIEDFKNSYFWLGGRTKKFKTLNQEIGYKEELSHFISVIKGSEKPKITYDEIYYSTLTTFKINESISKGTVIQI
ncbi:bi-domain-containing oxidoreductase [Thermodesulfovibrio sp. Kuro-1]|uniref:bi-domain-containing oxidoreductase n=1 Tax=Thermodesulfovibrio sp. Kuro-1 TaxID=2580394 RepID=UPI0015E83EFF|nr:bi-domain-containing oxidoreductase [Thermodesulfovibrio sp. Kuro-1]